MDGAMMNEIPMVDEVPIEQMADNLLVGDCETIAERLCGEIRAAEPSHMMFHFQVGASSHRQALDTMEKLATDITPMVEREMGPLSAIGGAAAGSHERGRGLSRAARPIAGSSLSVQVHCRHPSAYGYALQCP